jgi:hypothetical protein
MTVTVTIRNEINSTDDLAVHVETGVAGVRSVILAPGQLTKQDIKQEDEIALFSRPRIMK